jgi:hypothetical protein
MSRARRSRGGAPTVGINGPLVVIFGQLGFVYDGERLYVRIVAPRSGASIQPRGDAQHSYRVARAIQKDIDRAKKSKPSQRAPVLPAAQQERKASFGRARNVRKITRQQGENIGSPNPEAFTVAVESFEIGDLVT